MALRVWNDINLPGIARSQEKEEEKSVVTGVEDNSPEEEPEDEVRIISAEWVPGSKGFQYNENCYCDVSAEFLKETSRAKLRGNLHGIYDGVDEDMGLTVEGCIDNATMIARFSIPRLYFVNNDHYAAWQEDSSITCQYYIKDISHSLGANKIDSPMLDMPNDKTPELQKLSLFLEMIDPNDPERQNDLFTLYSTDQQQTYIQTKTVSDDAVPNNNTLELIFTDLDENLSYTLEVDTGDGSLPTKLLRNRAYGKWTGAADNLAESGKNSSGKKDSGLLKKAGDIKDKVSQAKDAVDDKINQANDLKQSAANQVNEVKSQADDIKSQGEATVKEQIKQANEIKQSAANQVDDVNSKVNDIKSQGEAIVTEQMNQANERRLGVSDKVNEKKVQTTGSLKDRLAAINTSREHVQKTAPAVKEKAAATADSLDNLEDSLKSVPKFTI